MATSSGNAQNAAMESYPPEAYWAIGIISAFILLFGGFLIKTILSQAAYEQSDAQKLEERRNPFSDYAMQILGLTFLLPTVMVVTVSTRLESQAVTALIGSIIGYVFGSSRRIERPVLQEVRSPAPPREASQDNQKSAPKDSAPLM